MISCHFSRSLAVIFILWFWSEIILGGHCHVLSAAEMRKTALVSQELRALAGDRQEEWSRKGDKDVANKKRLSVRDQY